MDELQLNVEIANAGLNMSMEFGENWLKAIDERLTIKYPELSINEVKIFGKLFKNVNADAHKFIRENPVKKGKKTALIGIDKFKVFVTLKYNWIDENNLRKLYSQSCYYALK